MSLRVPVILSGLFVLLVAAIALVAPALPVQSPTAQSVVRRLNAPSPRHPFGTDRLGRDVLSRVVWGTRVSIAVGAAVVAISALVGTVAGLISGYFRGPASDLLVRAVDVLQSFPALILALAVVTALGPGLATVIGGISLGYVPQFARVTRAAALAVREREYVEAARAAGASTRRILMRHVLPNGVDPVIVLCTHLAPAAILTEAMLSFLGLGITDPTPTWGNMIDNGRHVADLTDPHEVMDLAKRVLGEVGDVSILVNVAGGPVAPSHKDQLPRLPTRAFPIEEIADVDWARILATNLTTAFLVCRAFVPALKARRSGRIVNFTSIAARRGSDRVGVHYAAAKGGVIGLTKTLALELGPHGITVNAIAPGFINTERIDAVAWGRQAPGQHQALLDAIPLGRLGRPDDIAGIVALLCSDAGGYVSGATIDVNGGLYFGP